MGCVPALNPAENLNIFKQDGEGINDNNICGNEIWKTHLQHRRNDLFLLFRGCESSASPPFFCSSLRKIADAITILQSDPSYRHNRTFDLAAPANARGYGVFSVS